MKIAHIADLHFTTFFKENNLFQIEKILRYAIDSGCDHIVITGDLTDNADKKDFGILRNLFDELNLLDSKKLSIIIGNHDIFGGVQTAEDVIKFPGKCSRINYQRKIKEFYNYFPELFQECIYFDSKRIFPFAKTLDNYLLVGLNSIAKYSKITNPFASNGKINNRQIIEMQKIFEQFVGYKKIVLVHHHFNKIKTSEGSALNLWQNIEKQTMKLRKKKKLLNIFKQYGVELVLHGHYHESSKYRRKGIFFSNAGASLKGNVKDELNINMIDITDSTTEINIIPISVEENEIYSFAI